MSTVLLFTTTTGYQTRAFAAAAARRGIEIRLATDRCDRLADPWRDGAIAVRFHEPGVSLDRLAEALSARPVDGVLALGDRPSVLAALAAERLGLPGHGADAAAHARDKRRSRELWCGAGLPSPWFTSATLVEPPEEIAARAGYPCVVKPFGLSASRGVVRANTTEEAVAALRRVTALLQSREVRATRDSLHAGVLIEEYVPGQEFAVEGLVTHGDVRVLAIVDKPDPLEGPYFEETIYVTPSRAGEGEQRAIAAALVQAVRTLDLHHGPFHGECRVNARGVFVLEVAARPIGGLCARALRFVDPHGAPATLEELVLVHAAGGDVNAWRAAPEASGVMMIPVPRAGRLRGVDGLDAARAVPGVEDVVITAKMDEALVPLPEGSAYPGFIFASGTSPAHVERALRDAHAALAFRVDPAPRVAGAT